MTFLPVDKDGRIRLDALKEALCEDTILVSVMYVNNEVGSVQPIEEAVQIVKNYNEKHSVPCGCGSGIWEIPYFSKENRSGYDVGERT